MTELWACCYWPIVASRAWLDFWFGAATAHAAIAADELPCDDHDLFA